MNIFLLCLLVLVLVVVAATETRSTMVGALLLTDDIH